jgi:hypothetical protein
MSLRGFIQTAICLRSNLHHFQRQPLRAAFTAAAAQTKASENVQSLIRDKLNAVTSALTDISSHADWTSIEKEIDSLKKELEVCSDYFARHTQA